MQTILVNVLIFCAILLLLALAVAIVQVILILVDVRRFPVRSLGQVLGCQFAL